MRLRLITYNIHKGIGGLDRRYRPERIIEVISHYQPDVVLLQEVDEGVPRSAYHRQVDLFADALGFAHREFQQNVQLKTGHYGNAILSRFPLCDCCNVELTVKFKKRRRALVTTCHVEHEGQQRSVVIANVHLGLAGFERKMQVQRLLTDVALANHQVETPTIVAGDYNDMWGGLGRRLLLPAGFNAAVCQMRTFPAAMPLQPLDRIFYRGQIALEHAFAGRVDVARQASDHLPIIADFNLDVT